jgi:hypothetical protein
MSTEENKVLVRRFFEEGPLKEILALPMSYCHPISLCTHLFLPHQEVRG